MADFLNSTTGNGDDGGGLTDILSMALEQSGFDMLVTPTESETLTVPPLLTDESLKMVSTDAITITSTSVTNTTPLLLTPTTSIVDAPDNNAIDLDNMVNCLTGLEPSNDLSALLNETTFESFVSEPSTNFTMSTPLPAHRNPTKINIIPDAVKPTNNLSVNDVLKQLGLEAPTTSAPISLATVSGMIGSVCVTHLNKTPIR